jgi:hypothetical protein
LAAEADHVEDGASGGQSVLAAFPGPARAKEAMVALERAGIAHRDIRLLNAPAPSTRRETSHADERLLGWLGRRWMRGVLVGAVVGAACAVVLVVAVVLAREGALYPIWIGAAVGGAVVGAFVGGFLWVGVGMPRNPQAWDSYRLAHLDEACVAVRLRRSEVGARVTELLRTTGATSVERV